MKNEIFVNIFVVYFSIQLIALSLYKKMRAYRVDVLYFAVLFLYIFFSFVSYKIFLIFCYLYFYHYLGFSRLKSFTSFSVFLQSFFSLFIFIIVKWVNVTLTTNFYMHFCYLLINVYALKILHYFYTLLSLIINSHAYT